MNKNTIVYSFGIGEDISFDLSIIKNHGCQVYGFDPTPKSAKYIQNQNILNEFKFNDFGIGNKNQNAKFFLPKNEDFVSGSIIDRGELSKKNSIEVKLKTLKTISEDLGHDKIGVLKMDIEGAEYDVIEMLFEKDLKIDQILIEFHDRFFDDGVEKSKKAISFLNNQGYEIFAISDTYEEISFIKKSLLRE